MFNVKINNKDHKDNSINDDFEGIFFIGINFKGEDVNFTHASSVEIEAILEYINTHMK